MATKPVTLPAWNTGGTNNTVPSAGEKILGWTVGQAPPSSYFNWWQKLVYEWIAYLDDLEAQDFSWTGFHTFTEVTEMPGTIANGLHVDGGGAGTAAVKGVAFNAAERGLEGAGFGTGAGVYGTGGATGAGVYGTSAGSSGGFFQGTGASAGLIGQNSGTGNGGEFSASSTSALGAVCTGGSGAKGVATSQSDTKAGLIGDGTSAGAYGVIAEGDNTAPIRSAFRIVPQSDPPSTAQIGDLYVTTAGVLMINTGSGWTIVGTQT